VYEAIYGQRCPQMSPDSLARDGEGGRRSSACECALRFRVQGLVWFWVLGLGFGVYGLVLGVYGFLGLGRASASVCGASW
jgi:hypothetical protein